MKEFSSSHLKGKFVIAQSSAQYTHLVSKAYPIKLIIARNADRRPCQNGYHLSTAFLQNRRIDLDIELYRHPDDPNRFEFNFQDDYYTLSLDQSVAQIVPIGTLSPN